MEKIYHCKDVAKRYNVKVETVWSWVRNKKISAIMLGKNYVFRESALVAFEQERLTVPEQNMCTTGKILGQCE